MAHMMPRLLASNYVQIHCVCLIFITGDIFSVGFSSGDAGYWRLRVVAVLLACCLCCRWAWEEGCGVIPAGICPLVY